MSLLIVLDGHFVSLEKVHLLLKIVPFLLCNQKFNSCEHEFQYFELQMKFFWKEGELHRLRFKYTQVHVHVHVGELVCKMHQMQFPPQCQQVGSQVPSCRACQARGTWLTSELALGWVGECFPLYWSTSYEYTDIGRHHTTDYVVWCHTRNGKLEIK